MDLLLSAMRAGERGTDGHGRRDAAQPHPAGRLGLDVLGLGQPQLSVADDRVPLSQRHAEILLLLAEHPEGLGADHLALLLDDTDLDNGTIRAAVSRLRAVVGPSVFGSRPYRLCVPVATDVEALRAALDSGDVDSALRLYAGPVLPRSTAPGVIDIRDELRVRLRTAVLASGDTAGLRRWTAGPEARDDAAAWAPIELRWTGIRRCMRRSRPRSGCWTAAWAPMQRECNVSAHNLHSHRRGIASPRSCADRAERCASDFRPW